MGGFLSAPAADQAHFGRIDKPVLERQGKSNKGPGIAYKRETGRMHFEMGAANPSSG